MAVVDGATIAHSGHSEMEYKKIALEQVKETSQDADVVTAWEWFIVDLGPVASNRILEHLSNITPHFSTEKVTPSPIETVHPSVEGITVTVGRTPGKIIDDEIRE
jgi:hypothetical protein